MIVVKIELWPCGFESRKREIGRMLIDNQGGTAKRGNYRVRVLRKGSEDKVLREGEVTNYPRQSYNVWRLVCRALKSTFHEEQ
ncbi:unnamed protein product [marine sediment metagenome]|uniref:Uncharacterized protein n=1 Tax=marine sediment metagenome TaxID=412755 RepID=X0SHB5_9ZZZZ